MMGSATPWGPRRQKVSDPMGSATPWDPRPQEVSDLMVPVVTRATMSQLMRGDRQRLSKLTAGHAEHFGIADVAKSENKSRQETIQHHARPAVN